MARLGDVFPLVRNGASIKQTDGAAGIPITRIETISNREIDRNKFGYADIIDDSKYKDYILQDGDILMSHINSEKYLGKVALYRKQGNEQIIHGMNLLMLRANPSVLFPPFATYFFETPAFLMQIKKITKKSVNQASFTVTSLKEIEIPLPPLDEQRKIAAVLDKVSSLIAKRRQQLDKLDELIKARFVEMFGDEHHLDDWNCVSVGEVADICVGVVIKPTQYYTDQGGVPAFRSLNIGAMTIKNADWVYFTKEGHEKNKKSIVCENDVLVVRSGAPGTACVVTKEFSGYNAVDIIIAHPNIEKINSVFLAMFTNMPHGMNQIREKTGGAAQQHFNVGGYKELTVILPPIELQNQFAAFVEQTEKTKTTISESLQQLETLKKALMQEYFG